jgi:DDRGK domain-containing protein 1
MLCICKAEAAARDSRKSKQDHYEEMRRKKHEEREAQERLLVSHYFAVITSPSLSLFLFFEQ